MYYIHTYTHTQTERVSFVYEYTTSIRFEYDKQVIVSQLLRTANCACGQSCPTMPFKMPGVWLWKSLRHPISCGKCYSNSLIHNDWYVIWCSQEWLTNVEILSSTTQSWAMLFSIKMSSSWWLNFLSASNIQASITILSKVKWKLFI